MINLPVNVRQSLQMWVSIGDDRFLGKSINANVNGAVGVDLEIISSII